MISKELSAEVDLRKKKYLERFSNYENAVTLISSIEAWADYRWGPKGKEQAGLLKHFNRFPHSDGLTPDFEIVFHTPYVIWGDHKRTIQPAADDRDDVAQILKYASRRPLPETARSGPEGTSVSEVQPAYDVVVLVSSENDDVAAEAINVARRARLDRTPADGVERSTLAPIVVLGCHMDRESINGEWYKIKWRAHHANQRFSSSNISTDAAVEDLNALIVEKPYHPVRVSRPALGLSGRNPFINDSPPALYTAIRLVTPAINSLLSDEERDQLQSTGWVDKTLTRADLLNTDLVRKMSPQPQGLGRWMDAALDFLAADLGCAKVVPNTSPKQYVVTIDNALIRGDLRELFSDRAAIKSARAATKGTNRRRSRPDKTGQMTMFE